MKKILIIDHYSQTPDEPGNNRFIYLARMLCDAGYKVEIVTTDFAHKTKKTRRVDKEQLTALPYGFTMLPEPGYPRNVCLTRFYSHHAFGKNLGGYLQQMQRPNLVYAAVPSLDVGAVAGEYCAKNNVPYIVDIQDVWPEAFKLVFNIPVISDLIFAPMAVTANRIYAQAEKIVAVSETYKQRGLRSNRKDENGLCIYLGTDLHTFDVHAASTAVEKTDGQIWISYVGTLGHSYNIEIVMEALNLIPEDITENVVFKVLGDGPLMERFQACAAGCRVKVEFLGRMAYPQMAAHLRRADIAVNPIVKGAAQSIINKHADYAAAGLPVVSTQECLEYQALLKEYDCGISCPPDNPQQVAQALEKLIRDEALRRKMGANSRKMAEEKFDRASTYQKIVETIEDLVR